MLPKPLHSVVLFVPDDAGHGTLWSICAFELGFLPTVAPKNNPPEAPLQSAPDIESSWGQFMPLETNRRKPLDQRIN